MKNSRCQLVDQTIPGNWPCLTIHWRAQGHNQGTQGGEKGGETAGFETWGTGWEYKVHLLVLQ